MSQSPLVLDAKIAYYHMMSKFVQYKRGFLKDRISVTPDRILVERVQA